jgi:hypothetical protein
MLSRAGVHKHAIIKMLAGQETPNIETFISVLATLPRGARVPLEFLTAADRHRNKVQRCIFDWPLGTSNDF